eukprot:TRINITY_DN629_c0_g3_i1.p1 TRINITY_DN629_c0_g3~~TRINITY_DN629_c0_g3_i1.p1  ORF type:complete len:271 (+),score=52.04 TRINITY_DN629_c0_g3_i1:92-904(+)
MSRVLGSSARAAAKKVAPASPPQVSPRPAAPAKPAKAARRRPKVQKDAAPPPPRQVEAPSTPRKASDDATGKAPKTVRQRVKAKTTATATATPPPPSPGVADQAEAEAAPEEAAISSEASSTPRDSTSPPPPLPSPPPPSALAVLLPPPRAQAATDEVALLAALPEGRRTTVMMLASSHGVARAAWAAEVFGGAGHAAEGFLGRHAAVEGEPALRDKIAQDERVIWRTLMRMRPKAFRFDAAPAAEASFLSVQHKGPSPKRSRGALKPFR